jgi:hypothetical protein
MAKAAIEMSLGFIIAVVFAIVLLGLAITWIQSTIGGITDLTASMQQTAKSELDKTFREAGGDFDIYPISWEGKPGTKISVSAGINNIAADGQPHQFVIGVNVSKVPSGVNINTVKSWIVWAKDPKLIPINKNDNIPVIITIPANAIKDVYIIRITACSDIEHTKTGDVTRTKPPSADQCTPDSNFVWGVSKDFYFTVI